MTLKNFIKHLQKISKEVEQPEGAEVQMADMIPVVRPIFKDGVVYITDIDQKN